MYDGSYGTFQTDCRFFHLHHAPLVFIGAAPLLVNVWPSRGARFITAGQGSRYVIPEADLEIDPTEHTVVESLIELCGQISDISAAPNTSLGSIVSSEKN